MIIRSTSILKCVRNTGDADCESSIDFNRVLQYRILDEDNAEK